MSIFFKNVRALRPIAVRLWLFLYRLSDYFPIIYIKNKYIYNNIYSIRIGGIKSTFRHNNLKH